MCWPGGVRLKMRWTKAPRVVGKDEEGGRCDCSAARGGGDTLVNGYAGKVKYTNVRV